MAMSNAINPVAPHDLPAFITAPGETDILLNVMIGVLVIAVMMVGIVYLRLHSLPEHIAHRTTKVQYEVVAVLGLLALFTHNHLYWIAGLLLAMVQLPDFSTPLAGIADSLSRIARARETAVPRIEPPPPEHASPKIISEIAAPVAPVQEASHA
jgi:hypothetical protein